MAFISAGIMMAPMAATVAGEEPEMAAKKAQAAVAAIARPPDRPPKRAVATLISRLEMPPAVMMLPERTKNGIAIRVKESAELNICWMITSIGTSVKKRSASMTVATMATAIGVPVASIPARIRKTMALFISHPLRKSARSRYVHYCGAPVRPDREW